MSTQQKSFKIGHVFSVRGGMVIVGSDPNLLGISDEDLRDLAGKQITIHRPNEGTIGAVVLEVDVRAAISGLRVVFVAVPSECTIGASDIGGTVEWAGGRKGEEDSVDCSGAGQTSGADDHDRRR